MVNYVQMMYYFVFILFIFGVVELVYNIRCNCLFYFVKVVGVLIVGGFLAFGVVVFNFWIIYEYFKDIMCGELILEIIGDVFFSSEIEGLAWDYVVQWSNGAIDLFVFYILGVVGGGLQEVIGDDFVIVQDLRCKGVCLFVNFKVLLYWGDLFFMSGLIYFGSIVFFFFFMGFFLVKGLVKWWIGLGMFLMMLLLMGNNLEGFN